MLSVIIEIVFSGILFAIFAAVVLYKEKKAEKNKKIPTYEEMPGPELTDEDTDDFTPNTELSAEEAKRAEIEEYLFYQAKAEYLREKRIETQKKKKESKEYNDKINHNIKLCIMLSPTLYAALAVFGSDWDSDFYLLFKFMIVFETAFVLLAWIGGKIKKTPIAISALTYLTTMSIICAISMNSRMPVSLWKMLDIGYIVAHAALVISHLDKESENKGSNQ